MNLNRGHPEFDLEMELAALIPPLVCQPGEAYPSSPWSDNTPQYALALHICTDLGHGLSQRGLLPLLVSLRTKAGISIVVSTKYTAAHPNAKMKVAFQQIDWPTTRTNLHKVDEYIRRVYVDTGFWERDEMLEAI